MKDAGKTKRVGNSSASKLSGKSAPESKDSLTVTVNSDKEAEMAVVKARLHPVVTAAWTIRQFDTPLAENSLDAVVQELSRHVEDVKAGTLNRPEAILVTQAQTLDVIFNWFARQAGANVRANRDAAEVYMRLALKAQTQCRATLETLAEIKAPKPVNFIKQANVGHSVQVNNAAQQQVNNASSPNAVAPLALPRAHEKN